MGVCWAVRGAICRQGWDECASWDQWAGWNEFAWG
jgi:hypothetical protein